MQSPIKRSAAQQQCLMKRADTEQTEWIFATASIIRARVAISHVQIVKIPSAAHFAGKIENGPSRVSNTMEKML